MTSRALALVHPSLLALGWTFTAYLATGTPTWALWRPTVITVGLALLIQLLVTFLVRNRAVAALLASSAVLGLAATWTIALPLAGVVAWWFAVGRLRALRGRTRLSIQFLEQVSSGVGFVAIVLALMLGWQVAGTAAASTTRPPGVIVTPSRPNIYVVLLDGYPRADVLATRFDIDIGPFVEALEDRGFEVHAGSRSNYTSTWATLASMLQDEYLEDLPSLEGVPGTGPEQYRVLGRLVNDSPVLRELQVRGYHLVASPPPYSEVALSQADELLESIGPTWFEEQLMEKSVAATLLHLAMPDLFASQHRERIEGGLDRLAGAGRHDPPVFFFDHILSPHPPFVFTASGDARPLQDCFPSACSLWAPSLVRLETTRDEYGAALAGLIAHLNASLLTSIDELLEDDPDAVVVLFGDHATRYDIRGDSAEATRSFLATRTPGRTGLFEEDVSLINVFPVLLNQLIGTNLPMHSFKAWLSIGNDPLPLEPVP